MSKSTNNAIFLSDDDATIREKVQAMYTDPGHIHVSDPGKVEGNAVFTFLDAFDPKRDEVSELKEHYTKGGLGDTVLKKRLADLLCEKIAPIRERRMALAKNPAHVLSILEEGTRNVRAIAKKTLAEVRTKIGLNYFHPHAKN